MESKEKFNSVVLYVEDNRENARLMQMIFNRLEDTDLLIVGDAETALVAARETPPGLIMLDIRLPGMSGIEAIQELKKFEKTRDIPVIMVSADVVPSNINAAKAAGCRAFLTKPLDVNETLMTVRQHLAATLVASPACQDIYCPS